MVDNSTYEVRPLPTSVGRADDRNGRRAHVIRRAPPPSSPGDDARPLRPVIKRQPRSKLPHKTGPVSYTIELALFLDEAAYKIFYPFLNYNEADLRDMLLAYINGVSMNIIVYTRSKTLYPSLSGLRAQTQEVYNE